MHPIGNIALHQFDLGFTIEGPLVQHHCLEGPNHDIRRFGLLRKDFRSVTAA